MSPVSLHGLDVILAYAVFTSSCDGHVERVWDALCAATRIKGKSIMFIRAKLHTLFEMF